MLGYKTPIQLARAGNALQRYLVEETPHGIPAIIHNEALSGVVAPEYTAFLTSIGLAATWNPAGVEAMTELIKRQMRSVGMLQALSPVLDLGRDARWGRVHETYGEDAYLASAFAIAFIRGLQGGDLREGVIATAKHFLGYSLSQAGQNMAAVQLGAREIYEDWARPFEAAIHEAGLASVMNSYSTIDGVPVGGSRAILHDLLRDKLGFDGTVVSDYGTVQFSMNRQHAAKDAEEAGILALSAGLDVELADVFGYGSVIAGAVRSGAISEEFLDISARRVLRDKFELGLFENPYVTDDPIVIDELAHDGQELAQDVARQSVTLLKNDGNILPPSTKIRSVAIIGPYADSPSSNYAAYTYPAVAQLVRTIATGGPSGMAGFDEDTMADFSSPDSLEAIMAEIIPILSQTQEEFVRSIYHAQSLVDAVKALLPEATVTVAQGVGITPQDPVDIEAAVAAARDADVVIAAIGGRASWFTAGISEGEGADTANIELSLPQQKLINAVAESGTPIVAFLSMGRPYALTPVLDKLQAVITNYYGGTYGAQAAADAIFGVTNPGGRLPVTIPRHSGQVPIYSAHHVGSGYHRTAKDPHKGYLDMASTPLYPFGHGLSYTTFEYGTLELAEKSVSTDGAITVSTSVTNMGDRAGDEVVQLYISDEARGLTRPLRQLVAFTRITLEPGETGEVTFTVPLTQLGYVGLTGDFIIEPGPIELFVGSSSEDIRAEATVEITGETRTLTGKRTFVSDVNVTKSQKN